MRRRDPEMEAYFQRVDERVMARLRASRTTPATFQDQMKDPQFRQAMRRAFNSPYTALDDSIHRGSLTVMRMARAIACAGHIYRWVPRPLRQRIANRLNSRAAKR